MDRVGLGRALGYGARHAAKTLAQAARAASAPSASGPGATQQRSTTGSASVSRGSSLQDAATRVGEAQRAVAQAKERARAGAKGAGRSMLGPVRRVGGVLWLEMTGSVFAVFALFLTEGLWKLRAAVHAPSSSPEAHKFYLFLLMWAMFAYFAVSSFVRAHRRGKRP